MAPGAVLLSAASEVTRVHYYVHGRGRGHATRSRPIIAALRARGHLVTVFAGRDAQPVFDGDCLPVQSLPPGFDGRLVARYRTRVRSACVAVQQAHAGLIVSDGDMPAVRAARSLGVPSIAVGHGLVFARCQRPPGVPRRPWWNEGFKARLASLGATRCVAVNFMDLAPVDPTRTTVARPHFDAFPQRTSTEDGPVICYFRDGDGETIARTLAVHGCRVLLFGAPSAPPVPGISRVPFGREAFDDAMGRARAVVSSAGSQLMSECLSRRIPQLALYAERDDEQRLNGHMLSALACPSLALSRAHCGDQDIAEFVEGLPAAQDATAWPSGNLPSVDVVEAVLDQVQRLT